MELLYNLDKIEIATDLIIDFLKKNTESKIVAFYGQMGSGKTTLIKEVCQKFGAVNEVVSPTFAIINEYNTTSGAKLFHFDFYRLKNLQEVLDIGTEDYFYSGNYCFLEWPEIAEPILPENFIKVTIELISDFERKIILSIIKD